MIKALRLEMKKIANKKLIDDYQRFFKTGPGEYGEGDIFIGMRVPQIRKVAKEFRSLSLEEIEELLNSKIHEERMLSLIILVYQYKKAEPADKKKFADFYLKNVRRVNNWDLVDSSAPYILGDYFLERDKSILYKFAKSKNLWERRIAILSSFNFIDHGDYDDSLALAEILLNDHHDLIHKAVGWMLREIGKRDLKTEENFLKKHYKTMPRTMLRYAIERFPEKKRQAYLKGTL